MLPSAMATPLSGTARRCFPAPSTAGAKGEKGDTAAREYREALLRFVDDLLAVLFRPEWPAAEPVLLALCTTLTHAVQRSGLLAL